MGHLPDALPADSALRLPVDAADDTLRKAIAELDPDHRLGSAQHPVFLTAWLPCLKGGCLSFLGMSPAGQRWLAGLAGEDFAVRRRAELAAALAAADPDAVLPDDPVDQIIALVRALTTTESGRATWFALARQTLWCGPGGGSGLAHSCEPATGRPGVTGSYLAGGSGAQLLTEGGVDLAGLIDTQPWGPQLRAAVDAAETELDWPARVEFVVEQGTLTVVRATRAVLHGAALLDTVASRYERGRLTPAQAVRLVEPLDVERARAASVRSPALPVAARGLGASPGIDSGTVVFSAAAAVAAQADGQRPVLVLTESKPQDLPGLLACTAVVTERGGLTSHAAVVARGLGLPAVTALVDGVLDAGSRVLRTSRGGTVRAGDLITVDGHAGIVHLGGQEPSAERQATPQLPGWLDDALSGLPGIAVHVNADNGADAAAGRALGASGVGLCRLEHMFLGERHQVLRRVLMARPGPDMTEDLRTIHTFLRAEITDILTAMDGLPVTVRLLDPPRHEFLPDLTELSLTTAAGGASADRDRLDITRRLHEHNPMLGVRGVRMGILLPALTAVQIKALTEATHALRRAGREPRPELLVPMVSTPAELDFVRGVLDDVCTRLGTSAADVGITLGAMIETPRAALLARSLARRADLLCLGTNDLTALVWGLSRDDAEQHLLPAYQDMGLLDASPFARLDLEAVGTLARQVADEARAVRPDITLGVCGEQAADETAVRFFAEAGYHHISCAPPRIPLARLAAARAVAQEAAANHPTGARP